MPHRLSASYTKACGELADRLRGRFLEIEAAVLTRIREKAPIKPNADPEYTQGLHEAIRSAIKYTLSSIEVGEANAPPMPLPLLGQARLAARHGVALETVLLRYTLGAHQIGDLIVAEAKQDPRLLDDHLQQLLREQALVLERVLLELVHEYTREPTTRPRSLDARHAELVKRRLAGEPVDMSELHYEFDRHHIGVVSQGCHSAAVLHDLAKTIGGQLLCIRPGGDMTWVWIGTRHQVDPEHLLMRAADERTAAPRLAIGESGVGSLGWCRTHRQAQEAFPYLVREQADFVRYADIALKAALETHDLIPTSLHQLYIGPLRKQADDTLLPTLRAYFAAGHNGQAAAAALGVSRQTVSKRLRTIEAILRKPLERCRADLEIALRLEEPP